MPLLTSSATLASMTMYITTSGCSAVLADVPQQVQTSVSPLQSSIVHYIKIIYSGLSTRLLNHYCSQCREQKQKIVNSYEGNDPEKRCVLRRFRKTASAGADVTSDGRLFQRRHPATGNARSPTVDSRVHRITSCMDDDDRRRRRLESATSWMWSQRYSGARPCRHR